jgi:hypothetical protein
MTELHRGNIIELIGKDSRRYHSAIMTCFAFDFLFFEERLLPQLRSAAIKNIQVIADSSYVGRQLERTTGKEFRVSKTYTLTTACLGGIFHPKVLLLTGTRNGLLLIGSGNLTSSGISGNDEVWAAYQYAGPGCVHAGLFAQAWDYLNGLIDRHGRGFSLQGRHWMFQQSAWLGQLGPGAAGWVPVEEGVAASFLTPRPEVSLYEQLFDLLPEYYPEEVVVISPFYEADGRFITQLITDFHPGQVHCIVEPELGTVPYLLKPSRRLSYFEWKDCLEDAGRLHAKMIRFGYADEEYLVLGSANATTAAWGSFSQAAKNEEAILLIRAGRETDFLGQLGIVIPGDTVKLRPAAAAGSTLPERAAYGCQLTYAELKGRMLSGFTDEPVDDGMRLKTFDSDGFVLEEPTISITGSDFSAELQVAGPLFKIALFRGAERASNFMVVHRVDLLLKTNPDPRLEQLDLLFEKVGSGEALLSSLVDHFSLGWIDEGYNSGGARSAVSHRKGEAPEPDTRVYGRLGAEEFHDFQVRGESDLLESTEVRVADFLSMLNKELADQGREDFSDSAETGQLLDLGQPEGSGEVIPGRERRLTGTEQEQRALLRFFHKLHDFYEERLEGLYQNPTSFAGGGAVSIRALSQLHVAMDLYLYYLGRQYLPDTEPGQAYWRDFIPEGSLSDVGNARWFLADVLGKFLLLCIPGFTAYSGEMMTAKMAEFRDDLLGSALFAVLNVNWGQSGQVYRDTLLLNICQYLAPAEAVTSVQVLTEHLMQAAGRYRYRAAGFEPNCAYFLEVLFPAWLHWSGLYRQAEARPGLVLGLADIPTGQTVFRQKTGFACLAHKKRVADGQYQVALDASGYAWDEQAQADRLSGIAVGGRMLGFGIQARQHTLPEEVGL